MAYILKYSVRDFRDYDIHTLEGMIEPDPSNPALAKLNATEDVQGNLAVIEFDIRTSVNGASAVELFLDVEAQRDLHPAVENNQGRHTYSLAQRAVYYVSRMLSSQLSLRNNDYACLKPCYTIWLLLDPGKIPSQILEYHLTGNHLLNTDDDTTLKNEYDDKINLLNIVFIAVNRKDSSSAELLSLLHILFHKKDMSGLDNYVPTGDYNDFYKEVSDMCNLREMYIEQGIERGIEQGIERGIDLSYSHFIDRQLKRGKSRAEIEDALADSFGISLIEAKKILQRLFPAI